MSVTKKLLEASGGGEPTYVDDVFSTYLYTGTSANQDITNGIDLADKGGFVWLKNRTTAYQHMLFDTERGATKFLSSNTTQVETTDTTSLTSFNSDGFSIGAAGEINNNGTDVVSWSFAKQEGFFDVVTYTGNGVAGREIAHNLGSTPGMIIVKCLTDTKNWRVYHTSLGADYWLQLNETSDKTGPSAAIWNSTEPTSTVFTVGSSTTINGSGQDYVAYVFAHDAQEFGPDSDESIIKCGSYEGNGSTNGPEIDLGWEPQWLLIKDADGANNWIMQDVMRGIATNGNDPYLQPNDSNAESGNFDSVDVTATGFKIKTSSGMFNDSGKTHIYMAIRRPHKPAEEFEPDELFDVAARNPVTGQADIPSDFPVDMSWLKNPNSTTTSEGISSRLTQGKYMLPSANAAEGANFYMQYDYATGFGENTVSGTNGYMFRRAPGFFDVVTYEGDGVDDKVIPHNLQAVPEMFWMKSLSTTGDWFAYNKDLPLGFGDNYSGYLSLNSENSASTSSAIRMSGLTDESLMCSPQTGMNQLGVDYITYLFASVPGICNIGSYTGTGNDLNVDCGFTNGARFVLIKRTDSTGDWYYWDTLRGIVTGNDPYLLLNSTAAQVTNTDYIDPLSSGFTVTSSAPAALNASSGEYIYMAIA
jgi:hypothetical protein